MIQIIPAVLATSEEQYVRDIVKLSSSESLEGDWVHIDFVDNKFVQNHTIGPEVTKQSDSNFHKEAHLMVVNPKKWIDKLVEVGFERIIFHIESEDDPKEVIDYIKSKGIEVGLALNTDTPVSKVEPFLSKVEIVLIMTVVAGFQGQPFVAEALKKVEELKSNSSDMKVGVDGAVKDTNIKEIEKSGVDFVVIGSYLLEGDIEEKLESIWEEIYGA